MCLVKVLPSFSTHEKNGQGCQSQGQCGNMRLREEDRPEPSTGASLEPLWAHLWSLYRRVSRCSFIWVLFVCLLVCLLDFFVCLSVLQWLHWNSGSLFCLLACLIDCFFLFLCLSCSTYGGIQGLSWANKCFTTDLGLLFWGRSLFVPCVRVSQGSFRRNCLSRV